MEIFKKIGRALLFPPLAIAVILIPVATAFLIYSMVAVGTESLPAYLSYLLAFYTLTVWCVRIPRIIAAVKAFKNDNRYAQRWFGDVQWRTMITLSISLLWNSAYALFQLWLGMTHHTLLYYALAAYYFSLALMRIFLATHTRKYSAGEKMLAELKKYRLCGWIFLAMNTALTVMIAFMIYRNYAPQHHEIVTIAMAAYTFTTFTVAIVNLVRYRKYNSPVYSASKAISLAAACVSMITLTSTMLATFHDGAVEESRLMLALVGGAVSLFIIGMAAYMIVHSTKKIKAIKAKESYEP